MRARDIIVIARRRAGLTQQELGGRLGTSQVTSRTMGERRD